MTQNTLKMRINIVCAMQNVFWNLNYGLPLSMKIKRHLETLIRTRQSKSLKQFVVILIWKM